MKKQIGYPIHSRTGIGRDPAELDRLAADALTYLAADPDRLSRFFAVTGITVETLRHTAGTADFTMHLLDYMAADDRRLVAFAAAVDRDPAAIEAIRAALARPRDET